MPMVHECIEADITVNEVELRSSNPLRHPPTRHDIRDARRCRRNGRLRALDVMQRDAVPKCKSSVIPIVGFFACAL